MPERVPRTGPGRREPAEFDRDLDLRGIVAFGIGLALVMSVVLAIVWGLLSLFRAERAALDPPPSPLAEANRPRLPPEPRLQSAPREDMGRMRAAEEAVLESYGWVDRQGGIGRIPVERAIEILAHDGLPAVEPAAPSPPAASATGTAKAHPAKRAVPRRPRRTR